MPDWLAILPPLLAFCVAVWKKEVILALGVGLLSAELLLANFSPMGGLVGMLERMVSVFQDEDNTRLILFSILVGALLALMYQSGGVNAFVQQVANKGLARTQRQASLMTTFIGLFIFIESYLGMLTAGITSQKFFDRFKMSRERLAFIVDSTASPVSILILINGWGAFILGLMYAYDVGNPVSVVATSVLFNFYPIIILLFVFYTAYTGNVHGPLRHLEEQHSAHIEAKDQHTPTRSRYMLLPLILLVGGVLFFMWYTGEGNFLAGSGSKSVLWAVSLSILVCSLLLLKDRVFTHHEIIKVIFSGMAKLLPMGAIILLAFSLGAACKALGTGELIASMIGPHLSPIFIAPLLFICAGLAAFTTGTAWGTFALLIPIGIPLGLDLNIPPAFILGAILGGGVFGDHCSPISDSTILSSLASGCDNLSHVKTQLPYAMVAGFLAILSYLAVGIAIL